LCDKESSYILGKERVSLHDKTTISVVPNTAQMNSILRENYLNYFMHDQNFALFISKDK